jgi:glycerol uptake facilitator protein
MPAYMGFSMAFEIALIIVAIILGLGGQSGPAMNPARDLGPRLAHWLLPMANKGPTEW